ncbi:MAG: SIS domain-containing protein [Candidatus Aminicenantes bacterium]|jgi:D-sedoheptulose 7-phosphate isomerase
MIYDKRIQELARVMGSFFEKRGGDFGQVVHEFIDRLNRDQKVLVFGNGGSASQAQHFAAELVNKFLRKRSAIPAIALTTDTSVLTSIANDESFDAVFSRQVEALGKEGDIALGLTTSGNSPNIVEAVKRAKERGLLTIVFTGEGGGKIGPLPDILCDVPSSHTPLIQEVHLLLLHLLAEEIEKSIAR